jgi:hypothetical protein
MNARHEESAQGQLRSLVGKQSENLHLIDERANVRIQYAAERSAAQCFAANTSKRHLGHKDKNRRIFPFRVGSLALARRTQRQVLRRAFLESA